MITQKSIFLPTYILHNYKEYAISNQRMRTAKENSQLRYYQEFLAKLLDYEGIFKNMLVWHGLGSGKTVTAINIYNTLYRVTPDWNVFILLKASLIKSQWVPDLNKWLSEENKDQRINKDIFFISYDDPRANRQFIEKIRKSDIKRKNLYIIDESHRFISAVTSNIINKDSNKSLDIYNYIINDQKQNPHTRVILLSGTPAINVPFELGVMFNLLRPDIFPKDEQSFNQIFINSVTKTLDNKAVNLLQRRILGLVSYYSGATEGYFATQETFFINVNMSQYQQSIYERYEQIEKDTMVKTGSTNYYSYTRQSSNFVFPYIQANVNGDTRPRFKDFGLSENQNRILISHVDEIVEEDKDLLQKKQYLAALNNFIEATKDYFARQNKIDRENKYTFMDDFNKYQTKYSSDWDKFLTDSKKSKLFTALYDSSAKYTRSLFYILSSIGPVLVYSNFVRMEGLEIYKIYLDCIGFSNFDSDKETKYKYMEYHGEISMEKRNVNREKFNSVDNMYGKLCKVFLISAAGSEGINLKNVRQVHIMDPHWTEVRITQTIGRALRMGSHDALPVSERHVDIYRYKLVRENKIQTVDETIESGALEKLNLLNSFFKPIKEAAVDCELYKEHNSKVDGPLNCFKVENKHLLDINGIKNIYEDDIEADRKRTGIGLNGEGTYMADIAVVEVEIVFEIDSSGTLSEQVEKVWLNVEDMSVYEHTLKYLYGRLKCDEDNIPILTNDGYYIVNKISYI